MVFVQFSLNKKLRQAMDDSEVKEIEKQMEILKARHSILGIFKGKEKKAIEEQLEVLRQKKRTVSDEIATTKSSLQKQIDAENRSYENKKKPLRTRIDEIQNELTKAR
jgi:ABC-type phosphate transport system auxiliary subunit